MRSPLVPLPLLLTGLLLVGAARAQGDELERWLGWAESQGDLDRASEHLTAWRRRRPRLESDLLRVLAGGRDARLRRGAAVVLGALGDSAEVLRALEGHASDAVAPVASRAAARVRARRSLLARLRSLRDCAEAPPGGPECERLTAVARQLPPGEVRELVELAADPLFDLASPSRALRTVAVRLCGWAGGPEVVPLLEEVATRPLAEASTRRACLRALAARGAEEVLARVLLSLCERAPDWDLLVNEGLPLVDCARPAFRKLAAGLLAPDGAWPELQVRVAESFARRGCREAVPALAELAAEARGFDRRERAALRVALLRLDPERGAVHLRTLVEAAVSLDDALAEDVAEALAELRPPGVGALVEGVFRQPDPGGARRARAAILAEVLGLRGQAEVLSAAATDPTCPWIARQAAVHALGGLGVPEAVAALARVLREARGGGPAAALRREAADALGACEARSADGCAALAEALADSEPTVRRAALRGLAAYGDARALPRVKLLLREPAPSPRDARARLHAASALGLSDPQLAPRLLRSWREHPRDRRTGLAAVSFARGLPAGLAVEGLIELLGHADPEVREFAHSELLRRYPAGRAFGFAAPGATARLRAVEAWRRAWEENPQAFR